MWARDGPCGNSPAGTPCPVNKSGAQLRLASLAQALRLTKLMGWHVAGVRNEWADDLSRNCLEGFEQGCGGLDQFFDAGKVGLLGCHRRPI